MKLLTEDEIPNANGREKLAEGKTKIIWSHRTHSGFVEIQSLPKVSAGNGKRRDFLENKDVWANQTACNIFTLLKACGIPVAFDRKLDETTFLACRNEMILNEVVVRREAHGSELQRHPHLKKGQVFPQLVCEFFLKTKDNVWQGKKLTEDDPLMVIEEDGRAGIYIPNRPLTDAKSFEYFLNDYPLKDKPGRRKYVEELAKRVFLILEKAWQLQGGRLVDFKLEFGFDDEGNIYLSDVVDADSWRVIRDGGYFDKQIYRDGASPNDYAIKLAATAEITAQFTLPKQRVVIWRGSDKDDVSQFEKAYEPYLKSGVPMLYHTCSMHREPSRGLQELYNLLQEVPDAVIIAFVGKSNGAGPIISANSTVPVINVPQSFKSFKDDVWSSLQTPSDVSCTTSLEPKNALLEAMKILSARNPLLYSIIRYEQEKRMVNVVPAF